MSINPRESFRYNIFEDYLIFFFFLIKLFIYKRGFMLYEKITECIVLKYDYMLH